MVSSGGQKSSVNRVQYVVFNLPKKDEKVLQSEIQSVIELHYGQSPFIHINSKAYGHVVIKYATFKLYKPSEPSLRKLHGFESHGHHLIVSDRREWNFEKPCYHVPQTGCAWMHNLPSKVSEEDIWRFFERCGQIKLIYILRDERNGVPQQCFVHFEDQKSLSLALKLDKQPILDQSVRVSEFLVEKGLFLHNLSPKTELKEIETFLSDLKPLHICLFKETKSARVYFTEESCYWRAFTLSRKLLNGVPVNISGKCAVTHNIYVTNLPPGTTALELKSVFDWNVKSLKRLNYDITKITFQDAAKAEVALRVAEPVIHGTAITLYSDFTQASYALRNNDYDHTEGETKLQPKSGNSDRSIEVLTVVGPSTKIPEAVSKEKKDQSSSTLPTKTLKKLEGELTMKRKASTMSPKLFKKLKCCSKTTSPAKHQAGIIKSAEKKRKESHWNVFAV